MPRYFFDTCEDGHIIHDEVGTDLPDDEAVKKAAAHSLADIARDVLPRSQQKREYSIEVKNDQGQRILKAILIFDLDSGGDLEVR